MGTLEKERKYLYIENFIMIPIHIHIQIIYKASCMTNSFIQVTNSIRIIQVLKAVSIEKTILDEIVMT